MEKEMNFIKKLGYVLIGVIVLGAIAMFILAADSSYVSDLYIISGIAMLIVAVIYYLILYIHLAKLKSQNIIIEQNKEIIKLLSK